jgi:hypothetical protein
MKSLLSESVVLFNTEEYCNRSIRLSVTREDAEFVLDQQQVSGHLLITISCPTETVNFFFRLTHRQRFGTRGLLHEQERQVDVGARRKWSWQHGQHPRRHGKTMSLFSTIQHLKK